jgi:hypothetical protein
MIAAILLLLLTAAPALAQAPAVFNVKDYGAVGNGVTLDRSSINKAIGACAKAGGGTVYFPAGTYLTGTIRLESNVTLWIASGATLLGTKDLAQYEPAAKDSVGGPGGPGNNGFTRGIHDWYDAIILAEGAHDVGVIGSGVIDGQGVGNPNGEQKIRGPHALLFFNCQRVTVRDITIENPGNYNLILHRCEEVGIDGLTAHGGYDGINLMDIRNVTIANCRLFTGDDSLSGRQWERVTVSNCILNSGCNALRIGGRDILVTNCVIYGPAQHWSPTSQRFPTEAGFQAEGFVDNMILSDLTMINVGTPIYVNYTHRAPSAGADLGIGRIMVNNLTVLGGGKTPIYISAPADAPASSIILNNVRMTVRGGDNEEETEGQGYSSFSILRSYGVYARNVKSLELHDVRVGFDKADLRPALIAENVGVLDLDRFHAERAAEGSPSIQGSDIGRLVLDGKQVATTQARVTNIDLPQNGAVTAEPFELKVAVENPGAEGLASVPLQLGKESLTRSVWLKAGEKAELAFVNLESPESGEVEVRAGELAKPLHMHPRGTGGTVSAPYQTYEGAPATFKQFDKNTFYIRAGDDDPHVQHQPAMQYIDEYGAIYLNHGLPSDGTVVVKMDNPDLRGGWGGLTGIMVRSDITKLGQPGGYAILGSSPADGSYLEWAGEGSGLLNEHTKIEGYTVWPHWLKLERRGSEFTGYSSTDGVQWTKIGTAQVPGAQDVLDVGMFAFRGSARFENFTVEK